MVGRLKRLALAAACLGCAACAGSYTPIETPNPTETRRGEPGLFSGPDGEFTVFQGTL